MQTCGLRLKAGSTLPSQRQRIYVSTLYSIRSVSTSPYGRTHVWKRRPPVLPKPLVPKYPQTVIRSDGTSFVHWTTSPKSLVRLTRDTTNNPAWNSAEWANERGLEEEVGSTGRMGRFSRKFGNVSMPAAAPEQPSSKQAASANEKDVAMDETEGVRDMTGGIGMGGALDDVNWFEQMAELTGGEANAPEKGKKKEKKK